MKRAIFLVMVALLAMLILMPMGVAQDTMMTASPTASPGGDVSDLDTGGPSIVLPATALLLGSGILTYAILRRR